MLDQCNVSVPGLSAQVTEGLASVSQETKIPPGGSHWSREQNDTGNASELCNEFRQDVEHHDVSSEIKLDIGALPISEPLYRPSKQNGIRAGE